MDSFVESLQARIVTAGESGTRLNIVGGNSKHFYGGAPQGEPLDVGAHQGIVSYEPTELVVTARTGTPLVDLEQTLAESRQMLPFEPPAFGAGATIGGTIACGFSGPARPYRGAVRDFILGVNCVSGRGEYLRFGGQVMKNVAGYDVSRLMVGAMGTLGVMTEVSLKVLPLPVIERTLVFDCSGNNALTKMTDLGGRPLPVTGTVWHDGKLRVRLSGSEMAVESAASSLGGDLDIAGASFWQALKEHRLDFFGGTDPLWRLSIAAPAQMPDLPGESLVEWGGALFWVRSDDPQALVALARVHGGNLTRFRGAERSVSFQPLGDTEAALNRKMKKAFDPTGILNRDRLFAGS